MATETLWRWCYRPWPKAAKGVVGSAEWKALDTQLPRYIVEGDEAKWEECKALMDKHGYCAREVFRFVPGERPEPIAW